MGKEWDGSKIAYDVDVWRECLRVLKPGGHLLAFGGSRTWHRMAVAIEDAGFEMRDSIAWLHGQGFPKSQNVGGNSQFCQCLDGESQGESEGVERRGADDPVRVVRDHREAVSYTHLTLPTIYSV